MKPGWISNQTDGCQQVIPGVRSSSGDRILTAWNDLFIKVHWPVVP